MTFDALLFHFGLFDGGMGSIAQRMGFVEGEIGEGFGDVDAEKFGDVVGDGKIGEEVVVGFGCLEFDILGYVIVEGIGRIAVESFGDMVVERSGGVDVSGFAGYMTNRIGIVGS